MPKFPTLAHIDFAYTAIPDYFLDQIAPTLKEGELKVMLYIMRRTLGYRKTCDAISYEQFINGITTRDGRKLDQGAGVSRRALVTALASLEERGLIKRQRRAKQSDGNYQSVVIALNLSAVSEPLAKASPQKQVISEPVSTQSTIETQVAQVQNLPRAIEPAMQDLPTVAAKKVQDCDLSKESPESMQKINRGDGDNFQKAIKILQDGINGLTRKEAGKLADFALYQNVRDLAYLERLVFYVNSNPNIHTPAAVLTTLIRNNADRTSSLSAISARLDTPENASTVPGNVRETTLTKSQNSSSKSGRSWKNSPALITRNSSIDFAKYAAGGKYGYLSHNSMDAKESVWMSS